MHLKTYLHSSWSSFLLQSRHPREIGKFQPHYLQVHPLSERCQHQLNLDVHVHCIQQADYYACNIQ